ncbi:MAG: hypothetical protein Q8Q09_07455 [Deltaproteobacteria bacterium]|nr:hypothetical protein [Deltaproteobacteria bacterium]
MKTLQWTAISLCVSLSMACHEEPRANTEAGVADGGVVVDVPQPPPPDGGSAQPLETMPGHENLVQDTTPKRGPRMLAVESYLRSYMALFGGLAPLAVQTQIRSRSTSLFDSWNDYVAALGLPDYRFDIDRNTQMSALMLATLERTGIALCDAAVLRELDPAMPPAMASRTVFAFDLPAGSTPLTRDAFATRFDVLHRTFLGYPASLAPSTRVDRFYELYRTQSTRYEGAMATTAFRVRSNAGWASVCYGLVRHPEFQLY